MAKGFDPKWSLVGALVYFEGPAGATAVVDEKTNGKVNLYNGAQISHLSTHFPNGALWISDQAAPSKSGLALSAVDVFLGLMFASKTSLWPRLGVSADGGY